VVGTRKEINPFELKMIFETQIFAPTYFVKESSVKPFMVVINSVL
jgi:hypothetical protein